MPSGRNGLTGSAVARTHYPECHAKQSVYNGETPAAGPASRLTSVRKLGLFVRFARFSQAQGRIHC